MTVALLLPVTYSVPADSALSQRVLSPYAADESNGVEDARRGRQLHDCDVVTAEGHEIRIVAAN